MPRYLKLLSEARKAGIALLGGAATVASAGLLPTPWDRYAPIIIAIATYAGVYTVPNTTKKVNP
jgi:hypothetical protein